MRNLEFDEIKSVEISSVSERVAIMTGGSKTKLQHADFFEGHVEVSCEDGALKIKVNEPEDGEIISRPVSRDVIYLTVPEGTELEYINVDSVSGDINMAV